LIGLFTGNPGTAIPAMIVAGIGGIFYYNDTYAGGQDAWAYMWALIPGFVGIGSILAGLLGDNTRQNIRHGFNSLIFSAAAFLIFASIFGGLNLLGNYGPAILLIGLGVWLLARSLWKSFSKKGEENA
jgi:peptidoglycan/LPS O-acetylase OafA/YrhL